MDIKCPECKRANDITDDDLPECSCDSAEFECIYCCEVFMIGWVAHVEER